MSGRHARQVILPEVGEQGQARLAAARVLVVGAGGLGVPVLQYLAGAGVGRITLVDPDEVADHNLHRQPLYRIADIGRPKVEAARDALAALDPAVAVVAIREWFDPANAPALLADCDLALDCADNFAVSYALSDACQAAGKPLVSASALALQGYVGGFCGGAPSLRAVLPELPERAPSCDTAGVLGPVVGILGAMEAQMALSVLLGLRPSPLGRFVTLDVADWRIGGFRFDSAPEPGSPEPRFVAPSQITPADIAIDLRDADEAPLPAAPHALRIAPHELADWSPPPADRRVVMCCRTGLRSWHAARALRERWPGEVVVAAFGDRQA
ncbi:MAG: HesA/MoeB/ThiF family protein [Burkholderiaceae bacterium]